MSNWLGRPLGSYSLPYEYDALEPHISAHILKLHHLQDYVPHIEELRRVKNKLKNALSNRSNGHLAAALRLTPIIEHSGAVHINHSIYLRSMCPSGRPPSPDGELLPFICQSEYRDLRSLWTALRATALTIERDGWCWLALDKQRVLRVVWTYGWRECSRAENRWVSGVAGRSGQQIYRIKFRYHPLSCHRHAPTRL